LNSCLNCKNLDLNFGFEMVEEVKLGLSDAEANQHLPNVLTASHRCIHLQVKNDFVFESI